ncbi:MAG: helix-turn-helix transcriptional regulator [Rhodobacteraceae bacterium]|nr:helix-turn-helix transcriptional regulator [Paracoccaceae bacterium]
MSRPEPARVFAALGDPIRLALIDRLARGEALPLGRLVEGCGISRQGASKHLKVLEEAGLIQAETLGRERHLRLEPAGLEPARSYLDAIGQGWETALQSLKAHVEGKG